MNASTASVSSASSADAVFAIAPVTATDAVVTTARRIQTGETGARSPASRADAVLADTAAVAFENVSLASMTQLLQGDDLLSRLDEAQRNLLEEAESHRQRVAQSIAVTGGLSIGYVVWLVRGGVLMSSMLSALPAWQMVDPMPVLAAAGARRRRAAATSEDDDVERMFDADGPAKTPPSKVAPAPQATAATPAAERPAIAVPLTADSPQES